VRLDRRQAIRAAAVLGAGAAAAGCGAGGPDGPAPRPPAVSAAVSRGGDAGPAKPGAPAASGGTARAEVVHGPRDRPRVALTFHGQGAPALVRPLLRELAGAGARVTVLAVGTWLAANPGLGRQILADGHDLGNHTQHHLAIERLSGGDAYSEITSCARVLRAVTGSIGTWFRPSQTLHAGPRVRALAARAGYPTCLSYDVDSLDYTDPTPDAVVRQTLGGVRPGSIVSLHFGHAATVTAMPGILAGLRARGLAAVTVTELLGA
jgi:peptidoglycan/xylan/chitin deacetylase (PgdA/CDA1 family)